jgi:cell division septation protein DedD
VVTLAHRVGRHPRGENGELLLTERPDGSLKLAPQPERARRTDDDLETEVEELRELLATPPPEERLRAAEEELQLRRVEQSQKDAEQAARIEELRAIQQKAQGDALR